MDDARSDESVLKRIERLVDDEHRLLEQGSRAAADDAALASIQVELDQCWDLLRQRRALREAGGNPEQAHVRSPGVVERYVG